MLLLLFLWMRRILLLLRHNIKMKFLKKINPAPLSSLVHPPSPLSQSISPPSNFVANLVLEYLSHGYTLTDQALQTAIDYDHRTGLSKRFYGVLNTALGKAQGVDQKLGVTSRAATIDTKYGVQEKAKSTASGFMTYFENALGTPTGKKVRAFYDDRRKDALDIHAEARRYNPSPPLVGLDIADFGRLADERKGINSSSGSAPVEVSAPPAENVGTMTPGAEKLSGGDVGMI
jgi:hypothetical protein